jgi:hypothetical protein
MSIHSVYRYIQQVSIGFDRRVKIIYAKLFYYKKKEGKEIFLIKRERISNEQKKSEWD